MILKKAVVILTFTDKIILVYNYFVLRNSEAMITLGIKLFSVKLKLLGILEIVFKHV